MSNDKKSIDPVAELAAIRERGAAHLEELRAKAAARKAEIERIDAEERPIIEAAEREFAEELARKQHEIRVSEARTEYARQQASYSDVAADADEKVNRAEKLLAELADAYRDALEAELKRVEAGEDFRRWWNGAAKSVDATLSEPHVPARRLVARTGTYATVQQLARESHREVDAIAHRLLAHSPKQFGQYAYVQGKRVEL